MTKTFPVIKVTDTLQVVVEKGLIPVKGTWFITYHIGVQGVGRGWSKPMQYTEDGSQYEQILSVLAPEHKAKVIATIGEERIEGIPHIKVQDLRERESVIAGIEHARKVKNAFPDLSHAMIMSLFADGYEAAQSKGCYTEEDVKKAVRIGLFHGMNFSPKIVVAYEEALSSIQNKKDIASVELEVEPTKYERSKLTDFLNETPVIKITDPSTNTITPVKVNYHE